MNCTSLPIRLLILTASIANVFASTAQVATQDLPALFAARVKACVAVEFYVETEIDRRENISYGTVIDDQGTVILPPVAINLRVAPDQLKSFKIYMPGESIGTKGEYLGVDVVTGWHYVRGGPEMRAAVEPITRFVGKNTRDEPKLAEEVWGIALRGKDEDFLPYLLTSRVAMTNSLPQRTGIAQHEVASPGLPVFDRNGALLGLALSSFGQSYVQFSRAERGGAPVMLVNVEESSAFLLVSEIVPNLSRRPSSVFGRPIAWLGTFGLQPVAPEVARFLKLENQSAAVVSEVLEDSPAEQAGIKERDIIVAIDGKPLPRFKPDRVVISYLDRETDRRAPGDRLSLTILRDGKRLELTATLADAPKLAREAPRRYFDRLGLAAREFVFSDAVARRAKKADQTGIIAHFVKPSGPAGSAGLLMDDWIKEIDGQEVKTFEAATKLLGSIEVDPMRSEFVVLVARGGETSMLRIKLK